MTKKLNAQKWASFVSMYIIGGIPSIYFSYAIGVPALYIGCVSFAIYVTLVLLVYLYYHFTHKSDLSSDSRNNERRSINLDLKNESEIYLILKELSKKANVSVPALFVTKSNVLHMEFYARSLWPAPASIDISDGVIDTYPNSLTRESLEAYFAHELVHVKNHDSVITTFSGVILWMLKLYIAFASLCAAAFVLPLVLTKIPVYFANIALSQALSIVFSPIVMYGLGLLIYLPKHLLKHSIEFIADVESIAITKKPRSLAIAFREFKFHELRWGMVITDTPDETMFTKADYIKLQYLGVCLDAQKKERRAEHFSSVMDVLDEQAFKAYNIRPAPMFLSLFRRAYPSDKARQNLLKEFYPTEYKEQETIASKPSI